MKGQAEKSWAILSLKMIKPQELIPQNMKGLYNEGQKK